MRLILYFMALLATSCKSTQDVRMGNETNSEEYAVQEVPFEIVAQESHGGPLEAQYIEFKGKDTLNHFYTKVNMTRKPGLPVPEINFEKEAVVALCMGEKNTGGYSLEVDHIENTSEHQNVWIKEKTPNPTDMVATVICQPFTIVKFNKTGNPLLFKKVK